MSKRPKPVGKTTIILGPAINKAVNQYRMLNPTEENDLPTKTWAILDLLKKALAAEGTPIEEDLEKTEA